MDRRSDRLAKPTGLANFPVSHQPRVAVGPPELAALPEALASLGRGSGRRLSRIEPGRGYRRCRHSSAAVATGPKNYQARQARDQARKAAIEEIAKHPDLGFLRLPADHIERVGFRSQIADGDGAANAV
jgi:hypothetical protein